MRARTIPVQGPGPGQSRTGREDSRNVAYIPHVQNAQQGVPIYPLHVHFGRIIAAEERGEDH